MTKRKKNQNDKGKEDQNYPLQTIIQHKKELRKNKAKLARKFTW